MATASLSTPVTLLGSTIPRLAKVELRTPTGAWVWYERDGRHYKGVEYLATFPEYPQAGEAQIHTGQVLIG